MVGSLVLVLLQKIFSWFWQWNNFENRLIFGKVKAYKKLCHFWSTLKSIISAHRRSNAPSVVVRRRRCDGVFVVDGRPSLQTDTRHDVCRDALYSSATRRATACRELLIAELVVRRPRRCGLRSEKDDRWRPDYVNCILNFMYWPSPTRFTPVIILSCRLNYLLLARYVPNVGLAKRSMTSV